MILYVRIYIILAVLLFMIAVTGLFADDTVTRVTLSFDKTVYTNMPVWVSVRLPVDCKVSYLFPRYPYSYTPWDFGVSDFTVMQDGKPLPQVKRFGNSPYMRSGIMYGSGAPRSSPQGRLPLHLYYRFSKPGTYMVHYEGYDEYPGMPNRKLIAESEWMPIEVKLFSSKQRREWVKNQLSHQPNDIGLIVGDYIPSLLALPDTEVLPVFLKNLHHPDKFVQNYAMNAMNYYTDDVRRREILRAITKKGPTEPLAYYLSWQKAVFQPVGIQMVKSIIPYLISNSAETAGAAVHALNFLKAYYSWADKPTVPKTIDDAVWAAVPHIRKFKEREALWPLVLFMGGLKTNRAQILLRQFAEIPSVREQALRCLEWTKMPADQPK